MHAERREAARRELGKEATAGGGSRSALNTDELSTKAGEFLLFDGEPSC